MKLVGFWITIKLIGAALFYILSVLRTKKERCLDNGAKFLFTLAFILDCWATYEMYFIRPDAPWTLHHYVGISAILYAGIMQYFVWRVYAAKTEFVYTRYETFFVKNSYWFLLLWFIAAFLGVITAVMHASRYYTLQV